MVVCFGSVVVVVEVVVVVCFGRVVVVVEVVDVVVVVGLGTVTGVVVTGVEVDVESAVVVPVVDVESAVVVPVVDVESAVVVAVGRIGVGDVPVPTFAPGEDLVELGLAELVVSVWLDAAAFVLVVVCPGRISGKGLWPVPTGPTWCANAFVFARA